jgi:hypothetical protein
MQKLYKKEDLVYETWNSPCFDYLFCTSILRILLREM